jgi:hypothetical protein
LDSCIGSSVYRLSFQQGSEIGCCVQQVIADRA